MTHRKNPKFDIRSYKGLFFNVGLVVALGLVLTAFEWKTVIPTSDVPLTELPEEPFFYDPPFTKIPPPPPPLKVVNPVIVEKPDDEDLHKVRQIITIDPVDDVPDPVDFLPEPPEEKPEEIFTIVEDQPRFMNGGQEAFLKYVGSQLKYPSLARRTNIEGKVFVQFVIDKTGKMTDIEVVRGIGAGCDEEVLRVLHAAPAWEPGKQRGKAVKVRMIVPVTFRLSR